MKIYPMRCTQCGIPKAFDDFRLRRGRLNPNAECKKCSNSVWITEGRRERKRGEMRRYYDKNREAITSRNVAHRRELNEETRKSARRSGKVWTSAELETAARADLSTLDVAAITGRSLHAVSQVRSRMNREPRYAYLAGLDNELARLAQPETINVEPRYER